MKLQNYQYTIDVSRIRSKDELVAVFELMVDRLDRAADMDWSRVEIETDVDYVDSSTMYGPLEHIAIRTLQVKVPGLAESSDPVGDEA